MTTTISAVVHLNRDRTLEKKAGVWYLGTLNDYSDGLSWVPIKELSSYYIIAVLDEHRIFGALRNDIVCQCQSD